LGKRLSLLSAKGSDMGRDGIEPYRFPISDQVRIEQMAFSVHHGTVRSSVRKDV